MGVWNSCPCNYKRLGKFPVLKAVIGQLCGLVIIFRKNKEILSLYEINSDGHGPDCFLLGGSEVLGRVVSVLKYVFIK